MHKTEKRAKESRMNLTYSYLCDITLVWRNWCDIKVNKNSRVGEIKDSEKSQQRDTWDPIKTASCPYHETSLGTHGKSSVKKLPQ